jgi:hypothetical protein
MFGQVVGAHESLVANWAGEPLLARVGPQVTLELVGARETLAAKEPLAAEGPLARVPAQMGLQVRRLAVDFAAARNVTQMLFLLVLAVAVSSDARSCRGILEKRTNWLQSPFLLVRTFFSNEIDE